MPDAIGNTLNIQLGTPGAKTPIVVEIDGHSLTNGANILPSAEILLTCDNPAVATVPPKVSAPPGTQVLKIPVTLLGLVGDAIIGVTINLPPQFGFTKTIKGITKLHVTPPVDPQGLDHITISVHFDGSTPNAIIG